MGDTASDASSTWWMLPGSTVYQLNCRDIYPHYGDDHPHWRLGLRVKKFVVFSARRIYDRWRNLNWMIHEVYTYNSELQILLSCRWRCTVLTVFTGTLGTSEGCVSGRLFWKMMRHPMWTIISASLNLKGVMYFFVVFPLIRRTSFSGRQRTSSKCCDRSTGT